MSISATPEQREDYQYRKGFQQGFAKYRVILTHLVSRGFSYERAIAICEEFMTTELRKYRGDSSSFGHSPQSPDLRCEDDGRLMVTVYNADGESKTCPFDANRTGQFTVKENEQWGDKVKRVLQTIFQGENNAPNRLTIFAGNHIHTARTEAGLSLEALAEESYISINTLKAYEEGTKDLMVSDLLYLAYALKQPMLSFIPPEIAQAVDPQYLSLEEMDLLMLLHDVSDEDRDDLMKRIKAVITETN